MASQGRGELAYTVDSRLTWTAGGGVLEVFLETSVDKAGRAAEALDEGLERLRAEGLSGGELEAAKAMAVAGHLRAVEGKAAQVRLLAGLRGPRLGFRARRRSGATPSRRPLHEALDGFIKAVLAPERAIQASSSSRRSRRKEVTVASTRRKRSRRPRPFRFPGPPRRPGIGRARRCAARRGERQSSTGRPAGPWPRIGPSGLRNEAAAVPLDAVHLVAYPDVGSNNADLPADAFAHRTAGCPPRPPSCRSCGRRMPLRVASSRRCPAVPGADRVLDDGAAQERGPAASASGPRPCPVSPQRMIPALRIDYGEVGAAGGA
ncbi:MAG: insulinase family protein [Desulfobacterales bacterium]|nr:insulinase family protein [Desulfobacterales bacterium]